MGKALELITGFVTAPSSTFTAWTLASGNSLTIRNAPLDKRALLLQAWADNQVAGTMRIRSPRMHDNVQGIRLDIPVSDPCPLIPYNFPEDIVPQDILVVEHTGSAVAGDIETGCLLIWYEDLPGIDARLIDIPTLAKRKRRILTIENTLALGTLGGYSGEEALNSEFDLLKANTQYALLGYLVDGECACVRWRGADTGNLGIGGPGNELLRFLTCNWFIRLTRELGIPLIPVFDSANKAAILIDGAQDENGTDITLTSILAELAP